MANEWYYQQMGAEFGPLSSRKLKELANRGSILEDALVRRGESGKWVSAHKVKGLFEIIDSPSIQRRDIDIFEVTAATPIIADPPPLKAEPRIIASESGGSDSPPIFYSGKNKASTSKLKRWAIVCVIILSVIPLYSWAKNAKLRAELKGCESSRVIGADVRYASFFGTDSITFDLTGDDAPGARRIDPVHLLMQFACRIDLRQTRKIELANNGQVVFYLSSNDLEELSNSYENGGIGWAFNNMPERVKTPDGQQAFSTWQGGWLGVASKQIEDMNQLLDRWER